MQFVMIMRYLQPQLGSAVALWFPSCDKGKKVSWAKRIGLRYTAVSTGRPCAFGLRVRSDGDGGDHVVSLCFELCMKSNRFS